MHSFSCTKDHRVFAEGYSSCPWTTAGYILDKAWAGVGPDIAVSIVVPFKQHWYGTCSQKLCTLSSECRFQNVFVLHATHLCMLGNYRPLPSYLYWSMCEKHRSFGKRWKLCSLNFIRSPQLSN